jgi:hypothetical protein
MGLVGTGVGLDGWRRENILSAIEIGDYDVNELSVGVP